MAKPVTGLRANIALDLKTAELAIPMGRTAIPLAAIGIAAGFGFIRPGYNSSYGESLLLIVLLTAFGALGRTLGTAAVLAFGMADFVRFLTSPDKFVPFPTVNDAIGRVVTYGVLWLLVVYIPSIARRVEWAAETRRDMGLLGRFLASAIGAAVAGLGTYFWANLMPYLFRTAYRGSPYPATLQPQQHPELLALGVAAAYFLVVVFLRRGPINPVELSPLFGALHRGGISGLIVRLLAYGVLLLGLSGVVSGVLDVGVLVAGFVVAEVGAWLAGKSGPGGLVERHSSGVIMGAAVGVSGVVMLTVSWVASAIWPQGLVVSNSPLGFIQSPFLPIVLALAVAWPIARIGFSLAARAQRVSAPVVSGTIGATLAAILVCGGVLLAWLLMPAAAFADNCANLSDCFWTGLFLAAAFGFFLPALAIADAFSFSHPPDNVPSTNPNLSTFGQKKEPPKGTSARFNNIKRNGSDFFGGGGY